MSAHAWSIFLSRIGLGVIAGESEDKQLLRLSAYIEHLHAQLASLESDGLSGLYRREIGQAFLCRHIRNRAFGVFVLVDVDNLKSVHNAIAFSAGDRAIRLVSQAIHDCRRAEDIGVRWGGDEMVIGLRVDSAVSESAALKYADDLIRRIQTALVYACADGKGPEVTITAQSMRLRFTEAAPCSEGSHLLVSAIDDAFAQIQDQKKMKRFLAQHTLLPLLPGESMPDYLSRLKAMATDPIWPTGAYPCFTDWVDARRAAQLVLDAHVTP